MQTADCPSRCHLWKLMLIAFIIEKNTELETDVSFESTLLTQHSEKCVHVEKIA